MVTVIHGANEFTNDAMEGLSVADVRGNATLAQMLNIDPAAAAQVDGEAVTSSYVLQDGDVLEFVKPSGSKA